MNNVEYQRNKMNTLFGLDRKIGFKTNKYSFMQKICKNGSKITKNDPKSPLFDSIQQYSTLFDFKKGICFLYETKRVTCFDPIRLPNSKTNTE